jgi:hypothetical protein
MSRQAIGETLSHQLHRSEAAIDAALAEAAGLAGLLPGARAEAGLAAVTGQGAFDGAAATLTALTEARAHLVRTHITLAALARRLGLKAFAVGPVDKPDDRPPIGGNILSLLDSGRGPNLNKTLPGDSEAC